LRLSVVAVSLKKTVQREWLRAHRCALGQGWLFSRPLDAAAAEAMLHATADRPAPRKLIAIG
jgi:sensor c-di-GMP phosphodiesterase-like protein